MWNASSFNEIEPYLHVVVIMSLHMRKKNSENYSPKIYRAKKRHCYVSRKSEILTMNKPTVSGLHTSHISCRWSSWHRWRKASGVEGIGSKHFGAGLNVNFHTITGKNTFCERKKERKKESKETSGFLFGWSLGTFRAIEALLLFSSSSSALSACGLGGCPHRFRRELFRRSFRAVFRDAQLHWVRFCSVTEHKSIIVMSHDVIGQFHYILVFLTSRPFALEHFSFLIWNCF